MDLSLLSKLGQVAGVPGIALGAVALLLAAVVTSTHLLPETWRGPVLIVIIVGVVLLGLLAFLGWVCGKREDAQSADTEGDHSGASNIDKTMTGGGQRASTSGKNSPASNIRE